MPAKYTIESSASSSASDDLSYSGLSLTRPTSLELNRRFSAASPPTSSGLTDNTSGGAGFLMDDAFFDVRLQ